VLFQAGSSEVGREVAARFAEGVFTPRHTPASAQEFYRDLKGRMRKYDRPHEALKVMPGLNAIVGRTRKEAEELHYFLQSKIHPDVGLELLSNQLGGFDLSEYDLDGPLPDIPERQFALSGLGNTRNIIRWAREERLTIRQIYQRFAAARGQRTLIGSPSDIADNMEEWFCFGPSTKARRCGRIWGSNGRKRAAYEWHNRYEEEGIGSSMSSISAVMWCTASSVPFHEKWIPILSCP
jgi:N-acetyl-S-(2-succino)cysteine monooxygenase